MMEIKLIALLLLIGRLITVFFLARVLKIQINLLRMPLDDPAVWDFRRTLHYMTIVVFVGNFVPITIDLVTLFGTPRPFWLGVLYAFSNVVTAVFAALLIHKMYRLAGQTKEVNDLERKLVQEREDKRVANEKKQK